jgi:hypothetical protein
MYRQRKFSAKYGMLDAKLLYCMSVVLVPVDQQLQQAYTHTNWHSLIIHVCSFHSHSLVPFLSGCFFRFNRFIRDESEYWKGGSDTRIEHISSVSELSYFDRQ